MSKTFIHGMIAEKARLAIELLGEIMAEMPDELMFSHREQLAAAARSLQSIQHGLRRDDGKYEEE